MAKLLGGINPGQPLLYGGMPNLYGGNGTSSTKKKSSSKSGDDDVQMLKMQQFENMREESNISALASNAKYQLMDIYSEYNGDRNAFIQDKRVKGIIGELNGRRSLNRFNEQVGARNLEKYNEDLTKIKTYNAENDYAVDSSGNRIFVDENGEIVRDQKKIKSMVDESYRTGEAKGFYLNNKEYINYQDENLGSNEHGVYDSYDNLALIDNTKSYFKNSLRDIMSKDIALYEKGSSGVGVSGVGGSHRMFSWNTVVSNKDRLQKRVMHIKTNLSDIETRDAQQEYWRNGWDNAVLIESDKKEKTLEDVAAGFSLMDKGEYQRLKEIPESQLTKEQKNILNNAVVDEDQKFNKFLLHNAYAIEQGHEVTSIKKERRINRLTEGEFASANDRTMNVFDVGASLLGSGTLYGNGEKGAPAGRRVRYHKQGNGKYKKVTTTGERTQPLNINAIEKQNKSMPGVKYDEDGNRSFDQSQMLTAYDMTGGQAIFINGAEVRGEDLKKVYIAGYNPTMFTGPKTAADGSAIEGDAANPYIGVQFIIDDEIIDNFPLPDINNPSYDGDDQYFDDFGSKTKWYGDTPSSEFNSQYGAENRDGFDKNRTWDNEGIFVSGELPIVPSVQSTNAAGTHGTGHTAGNRDVVLTIEQQNLAKFIQLAAEKEAIINQ